MPSYLGSVLLLFVLAACVTSISLPSKDHSIKFPWPWSNDGMVNPPEYYQRYRRTEYPVDRPYFQWWYFYFSDFAAQKYYFIAYALDQTFADQPSLHNVKMGVGQVDVAAGTRWGTLEKFTWDSLTVSNYYDLQIDVEGKTLFTLKALDNNTYHLTGQMTNPANATWFDASANSTVTVDTPIYWDLTLNRIEGWYGEQDLEEISVKLGQGEICWNPYAHNSLVQGSFTIGDQVFNFDHSVNYRGYGDMNWGSLFPQGNGQNDITYPWGWYTVAVPNADPQEDFSIVVGEGLTYMGFPEGSVQAFFGDFRLNSTTRIGIREVRVWDGTVFSDPIVATASDGKLIFVNVTRSNWVTMADLGRNYSIPLHQTLLIKTTHYDIMLDYYTTTSRINRIPFMDAQFVFSDFEGLGSDVHVVIKYTEADGSVSTLYDFWSHSAGVEYGYRTIG